ncbi:MAG: 50S ribosomal protein L10 [Planctomycetes bacterium]|nr:50S ribosomal protein L10 [Planctomycetota bacterium]
MKRLPNVVNRLVVQELTHEFKDVDGMVVVSWGALNAVENETLRDTLAEKGCKLSLVRNSLARRVLKEKGFDLADDVLKGNTAIAYGKAEAVVHAAKAFTTAEVKKIGKVKIRAGVLEGRLLDANDAAALADVPDRKTLEAKIVGCLSGPPRSLVSLVNQVPSGLVRVLQARADNLAKAGG